MAKTTSDKMFKIQLWMKDTDARVGNPLLTFGNVTNWDMIGASRLKLEFDHGGTDIVPIDKIGYIKVRIQD